MTLYFKGYHTLKAYIATQGPLPGTSGDFWKMVWQVKCATIVMLTREREGGKPKCHKYWPESGVINFSNLQVIHRSENDYSDYVLREFSVVDTEVRYL